MMTVRVALPSRVLGSWEVTSLRGEGAHGSFGMRPRHVDYVVVLEPGIMELTLADGTERFLALDTGVLVKQGKMVFVSTRRAVESANLDELQQTVREVFVKRTEGELRARAAASKLEVGFVRRLLEIGESTRGW
jgi:F-type H+-transporting ATPase subunit epsilon